MKFDRNQNVFPSIAHKSILHAAVFMAPLYKFVPIYYKDIKAEGLMEGENLVDIGGQQRSMCVEVNRLNVINPDIFDLQNLMQTIEVYIDKMIE